MATSKKTAKPAAASASNVASANSFDASSTTRDELTDALNQDLAREYQAIIAYVVYSQAIKGAQFMNIAKELEKHAHEELSHALAVAKLIDYLGGEITAVPKPVKTSDDERTMLRYDLENETETILEYRKRILQAEALGEYAISEHIREILVDEQEHLIDLATALGEDPPILTSPVRKKR